MHYNYEAKASGISGSSSKERERKIKRASIEKKGQMRQALSKEKLQLVTDSVKMNSNRQLFSYCPVTEICSV